MVCYTANPIRRREIAVLVALDTDLAQAEKIALEIVRAHAICEPRPAPAMLTESVGAVGYQSQNSILGCGGQCFFACAERADRHDRICFRRVWHSHSQAHAAADRRAGRRAVCACKRRGWGLMRSWHGRRRVHPAAAWELSSRLRDTGQHVRMQTVRRILIRVIALLVLVGLVAVLTSPTVSAHRLPPRSLFETEEQWLEAVALFKENDYHDVVLQSGFFQLGEDVYGITDRPALRSEAPEDLYLVGADAAIIRSVAGNAFLVLWDGAVTADVGEDVHAVGLGTVFVNATIGGNAAIAVPSVEFGRDSIAGAGRGSQIACARTISRAIFSACARSVSSATSTAISRRRIGLAV